MADGLLGGRYRLDEVLGHGGMATVWRGWDLRLQRPVAVRTLDREELLEPDGAQRFDREARTVARLIHPHIVSIFDAGTHHGIGYLVMELIDGLSVAELLAAGPLPVGQAMSVAAQTCQALAAAHAAGIVHRDITPANIMLTRTGQVKVCDFGIAAAAAHQDREAAVIAGTPGYTAPERLHGAEPDPAADVYSLAVVVYEMLTGMLPRPTETWTQLAGADFATPVPMPAGIDPDTADMLAVALGAAAGRRPTAGALAAAFDISSTPAAPAAGGPSRAARTTLTVLPSRPVAGVAAVARPRPAPTTVADPVTLANDRSPVRTGVIAAITLVAVMAGFFGYAALHHPAPSAGATGPTALPASTPAATSSSPSTASTSPASAINALLSRLRQTIQTADADGSLGHNLAQTLSTRAQNIQAAWNQHDLTQFRDQCLLLHNDLHQSNRHGDHGGDGNGGGGDGGGGNGAGQNAATAAVTQQIDSILNQLLAAADATGPTTGGR